MRKLFIKTLCMLLAALSVSFLISPVSYTVGQDTIHPYYYEYNLRAITDLEVYATPIGGKINEISAGTYLAGYLTGNEFVEVSRRGEVLGYVRSEGVVEADEVKIYASLPVEYGEFRIGDGQTYYGVSRLVDVAEYNDQLEIPMIIDMRLSYDDPDSLFPRPAFYKRNLCMLQYDALVLLLEAQKKFNELGYTIMICDAYRPTSVQQSWFDIVGVHKWVASPSYGDGGMHDRGVAVDISLVDLETGEEIDMPTPMHTFSVDSARTSTAWTEEQRRNVDQLTYVMTQLGFTYINSEWWHFQLKDKNSYLPTDHPIDEIPLVLYQ